MADYISREAAINTQERRCLGCPVDRRLCYKCAATTTKQQLLEIPAADVRPVVRGRWEFRSTDTLASKAWTCSVCGRRKVFKTNFCPNCGADMREVKSDGK